MLIPICLLNCTCQYPIAMHCLGSAWVACKIYGRRSWLVGERWWRSTAVSADDWLQDGRSSSCYAE